MEVLGEETANREEDEERVKEEVSGGSGEHGEGDRA